MKASQMSNPLPTPLSTTSRLNVDTTQGRGGWAFSTTKKTNCSLSLEPRGARVVRYGGFTGFLPSDQTTDRLSNVKKHRNLLQASPTTRERATHLPYIHTYFIHAGRFLLFTRVAPSGGLYSI